MAEDFDSAIGQVFVVGTGRCGSTLLSAMLRQHPQLLSLSECIGFLTDLGCRIPACFPPESLDGAAFWRMLDAPAPRLNAMLRQRVEMPEVLYQADRPQARFTRDSGVPPLLQTCLPHLYADQADPSAAAEACYDALHAFCHTLPAAPVAWQYQRVFAWLAARAGARLWVERSGGGLRIVERLIQHFPQARFVHIVRNGPDTALSMSRHVGFRMAFGVYQLSEILGVDPWLSDDRHWEGDLSDEQAALLPEVFSAQALHDFDAAPPLCGHYWSGEIVQGLPHLQALGPQRCLHLHYEDLLRTPQASALQLLDFIGQGRLDTTHQAAWLHQVAAMIKTPRSDWQTLPARLRAQTEEACAPGMAALAALSLA